jgi:hypothetical protein
MLFYLLSLLLLLVVVVVVVYVYVYDCHTCPILKKGSLLSISKSFPAILQENLSDTFGFGFAEICITCEIN